MGGNSGYLKLHRKMLDWEWHDDPHTLALFIHLLLLASHKPTKWHGVDVGRGQLVVGRQYLSELTGLSEQMVRTCLDRLKSTNEITSKSTNRYTLITIVKWDSYQTADEESTSKSTSDLTNNQPTDNQQITTYKKVENVEKVRSSGNPKKITKYSPEPDVVNQVIGDMNAILGSGYKTMGRTRTLVEHLLKEGFQTEDLLAVVRHKKEQWGPDPKMREYLRPETLFSGKFESYLQVAVKEQRAKERLAHAELGYEFNESELLPEVRAAWPALMEHLTGVKT